MGKLKNLFEKKNNLRVGFAQLICFEKLYNEEPDKEDTPVDTINITEMISLDGAKSIQDDFWFN